MMEKRLRVARSTALLGVTLAIALLAIPAAALSGGEDADSRTTAAWQALSSGGPPVSPSDQLRSDLVRAFAAALSQTDFQRALEQPPAQPDSDVGD